MSYERNKFDIHKKCIEILERDNFTCLVCGKTAQHIAHGLSRSKLNLKKYGDDIVNHSYNLHSVCSLNCNSKCNIDNNPEKIKEIIEKIKESIRI